MENNLILKVIKVTIQGGTCTSTQKFIDDEGKCQDPETITINVINPSGNTILTDQQPEKKSTGQYSFNYTFALDADLGEWTIRWNISLFDNEITFDDTILVEKRPVPHEDITIEGSPVELCISTISDQQIKKYDKVYIDFNLENKFQTPFSIDGILVLLEGNELPFKVYSNDNVNNRFGVYLDTSELSKGRYDLEFGILCGDETYNFIQEIQVI